MIIPHARPTNRNALIFEPSLPHPGMFIFFAIDFPNLFSHRISTEIIESKPAFAKIRCREESGKECLFVKFCAHDRCPFHAARLAPRTTRSRRDVAQSDGRRGSGEG